MELNTQQRQAVKKTDGQLVIVACPGSGKTTTLLNRVHYMTNDLNIDSESIMLVTFSKEATKEMKDRYSRYPNAKKVYFGTIHSFCLGLIKKFTPEKFGAGVISEKEVIDYLINSSSLDVSVGNKYDFIKDLLLDIGNLKNSQKSIDTFIPKCLNESNKFLRLFNEYEIFKHRQNKIDYEDMMLIAYELLIANSDVRSFVRNRYKYVMVDEYQDVNALQRDIIYEIAGMDGNLTVVGDDDQAIYGFRGASSSIMLDFKKHYPDSTMIYLSTNYRSRDEIVKKAGTLIVRNQVRFDKEFKSVRGEGGPGTTQIAVKETRDEEIDLLARDVSRAIEDGTNPEDIAVIYRINKQATLVAHTFKNYEIDFKTNEKIPSIFDSFIYNDILAFYRMATGEGTQEDFKNTLNKPNRYIRDPNMLRNGPDKEYMIDLVLSGNDEQWKKDKKVESIEEYFTTLDAIRKSNNPAAVIKNLINLGKYRNYLTECADFRNEDEGELNTVLDELLLSASKYETISEWKRAAYEEKQKFKDLIKEQRGVTLTTMHGAKGLEWKHVYIIDCVEGKCPYTKAHTPDELEEERRLFYVAMTRAKDRLVVMRYKQEGSRILQPSRYLKESGYKDPEEEKNSYQHTGTVMQKKKPIIARSSSSSAPEINVGDTVNHIMYDEGTITSVDKDINGKTCKFTVRFVLDGNKMFNYPDVFSKGMKWVRSK